MGKWTRIRHRLRCRDEADEGGILVCLCFLALLALFKYFFNFKRTRLPPSCYANSPKGGELPPPPLRGPLPQGGIINILPLGGVRSKTGREVIPVYPLLRTVGTSLFQPSPDTSCHPLLRGENYPPRHFVALSPKGGELKFLLF